MMPVFKGKDGTGKEKTFVREEGYTWPIKAVERFMKNDLKKRLEEIKYFDVRSDDILVCAYMKSGTHWLWEIVSMVINKTSEYDKNVKEIAMMEFRTPEELHALPSPRLLNLHMCFKSIPQQAIQKKIPILHIMRNPKDVCVSYYHHYQALPSYEDVDNFSAFLPMFLGETGFYLFYPWYQYELEWEQFSRDSPDYPILNLYYEDLKQDLKLSVSKVAEFLNVDISEELVKQIADRCHIDNMRNATKANDKNKHTTVDGKPLMYRKGQVGDWKNWFTVAESERFDRWLEENLRDTNLKFKYTLTSTD